MVRMRKQLIVLLCIAFVFVVSGNTYAVKDAKEKYKIEAGKDITLYVATDIHYLSPELTDHGAAFKKYVSDGDGKQLDYNNEIMSAFTQEIQCKKPDILLISGDLTNNGEKKSHQDLSKKLNEIEKGGTAVYVIPGNHDILNPWASYFTGSKQYRSDYISEKEFRKIYGNFGYDEAISTDKHTLSYLAAPAEDLWLLMLDTSQYKDNVRRDVPQKEGVITEETFKWIKQCTALAKEKGANLIPVMHHSLISHSDVLQHGFTIEKSKKIADWFAAQGISFALTGHIHIQDISSYKKDSMVVYDIATSSLVVYPEQYGILRYVGKDASFDYHTAKVDVEKWAKETGRQDPHLDQFNTYAEEFFCRFAYDMAYNKLVKQKNLSEKQIREMSEDIKLLSQRFFSGTENTRLSKGLAVSPDELDGFIKLYVSSILKDDDMQDNELHISPQ